MTKDEALKLAREAGAIHIHERPKEFAIVGNEAITLFAALVREDAQRKPLTEAEIEAALKAACMHSTIESRKDMRRAIEAAHGITAATQLKE